jgi:hypothetical protein
MTIKIPLPHNTLTGEQEQWLAKNVGPRMHYLHNSIGGQGWLVKNEWEPSMVQKRWYLTLEDERLATFFAIKFSS